jgi:hypothetical protein
MTQVVEHLPQVGNALNLIPSTDKKKRKKEQGNDKYLKRYS